MGGLRFWACILLLPTLLCADLSNHHYATNAAPRCAQTLDVVFVVDGTNHSMNYDDIQRDMDSLKAYLKNISHQLFARTADLRIAQVVFGSEGQRNFPYTNNGNQVSSFIDEMRHCDGPPDIRKGLQIARGLLQEQIHLRRAFRILLVTANTSKHEKEGVHYQGDPTKLVIIAVGYTHGVTKSVLQRITGKDSNVLVTTKSDSLYSTVDMTVNKLLCIEKNSRKRTVNVTVITMVSPQYGPTAGGTLVLIEGLHFNSPDEPLVRFNNIPCPLMNSSNTQIKCLSDSVSSSYTDQVLPLCITWQRTDITTCYNDSFTYLPDPTVSRIFPTETFLSGGTNVTVIGTNLMSVAQPALVITIIYRPSTYQGNFTSSCEHISNNRLICDTPNITVPDEVKQAIIEQSGSQPVRRRRSQTNKLQILTSIQLDAVKDLNAQDVPFTIPANPEVMRLTETLVFQPFWPFNDKKFDIKGSGFGTDAALSGTLVVLIGSGQCLTVQRWDNLIECTLSSNRPPNGDKDKEGEYAIQVLIGRGLRFDVGYMDFQQNIFYYPPGRIGLIVGSVFLIVLIVAMLVCRRFKPSPKDTPPRTIESLRLQRIPVAETHNAPSSGYENTFGNQALHNPQSPSGSSPGRNRSARRLLRALNLI